MNVNQILLGLLGRALFAVTVSCDAGNTPWAALFAESRAQAVELLVFDALTAEERSAMPPELAQAWQRMSLQRLMHNEQLRYEQRQILEALAKDHIPCVILKGSSCAENYPKPSLRNAGDIDLLVGDEGVAPAQKALEGLGFVASEDPHPYHLHMRSKTQIVELHYEPAGIPQGKVGEQLRGLFTEAEKKAVMQNGIPVLPTHEQAMVLILHKLEHIVSSGLGLRQLCDWAVFVHRQLTDADWVELEPTLRELGLLHFTKIVTRMCVDGLGLPERFAPWCLDADKLLAEQLLADILRTGNFGRKENRYGQRLFTNANSGNRVTSFLRVGVQTCRDHWPVCERHPVLLPVAPFVLLNRYRKHRKEGKRPAFRPHEMYQSAKDRQALYASLKPFVQ